MSEDDPVAGPTDDDTRASLRGRLAPLVSSARFGKFASVGAIGAGFDLTASTTLRELGVFPEVAVFIGIEVAIVVMFLLNDNWTFSARGTGGVLPTLGRLGRSHLVRLGGTLVQLATFSLLYRVVALELTVAGIDGWFVASKVTGIGVAMFVNYVAESLFTWRVHAE